MMKALRGLAQKSALAAALYVVWAIAPLPLQAQQQVGVILMHGKWGSPDKGIAPVELALRGAGFLVVSREMAWSERRAYDMSLDQVMVELEREVARLKASGARKIVIGGHSFGANMALAYGARHPDLDGVGVLAPGHVPERFGRRPAMRESLAKARALLAAGKGEQFANFEDMNQDKTRQVSAKPAVYISFFDPDGDAVMPRNAARLSPHTALLWVVGTKDRLYQAGKGYAFDRAPANPLSVYKTVEADHSRTPAAARDIVVQWIKTLP